jgi:TorA maturation chaperone TorD
MNQHTFPVEIELETEHPPEDAARADMYALIAALFHEPPSQSLLGMLASAPPLAGDGSATLPKAWEDLQRTAVGASADALREEYDTHFVSIGEAPVLLYASHYLTGYLHERPLAELREALAQLGLARKDGTNEPEDHISAIADVMRFLITNDAGFEAQRRFFDRFVRSWYGGLADRVEARVEADFYKALGRFTRAFLDVESGLFDLEIA